MDKLLKHFIPRILIITAFVVVLIVFSVYKKPASSEAASPVEFGGLVCDEFIPIGSALNGLNGILASAFNIYNGESMNAAMDNINGIFSALIDRDNVCDFSRCLPSFVDQSATMSLEFKSLFLQTSISGDLPPWCVPKEGIGEPCPNISEYLKDDETDDKTIAGLKILQKSFLSSAKMLHDIFDEETKHLPIDLLKEGESAGDKTTEAELVRRLAEKSESLFTPGIPRSCALTSLQRGLIEDGRMGNRFPTQCSAAFEAGTYWPRLWSEDCDVKCTTQSERECIKCLDEHPGKYASELANINYKIYGTCSDKCSYEDPPGSNDVVWGMNEQCQKCLCTKKVPVVYGVGIGADEVLQDEELSPEACMDWLCGGSSSNWVCCHEGLLEGFSDRPELL